MRLFIIANRLPLKVNRTEDGKFEYNRSEGGLATGLGSLDMTIEKHWIGWPGIHLEDKSEIKHVTEHLESFNFHPVFLSENQIQYYYEGYSNNILWPLCHYFFSFIEYDTNYWKIYKEVNALFGKISSLFIQSGDIVWIHDYHLMLLPKIIRDSNKSVSIGYFHHIPFPSYELFRVLPERASLLEGLLGADLVAFHTHDYMRHFISTAERVLDLQFNLDQVLIDNRMVNVDAFPMGINYDLYHDAILNPNVLETSKALKDKFGNHKLMLSVDRLDYSKGILHRIKGFAQFLDHNPQYRGKISLVMIVVPSRGNVEHYAQLKAQIDKYIGSINGRYSTINWNPIYYFYRSFDFEELSAFYHIANIALITPLRDGMNLVAKEYVAAKRDEPGVLILSEMAGASIELNEAIIINPNSLDQIEMAIVDALEMSLEEQYQKIGKMQKIIAKHTVKNWAEGFVNELEQIRFNNLENDKKRIDGLLKRKIRKSYQKAQKRLIILDYDGTLSPFKNRPEEAYPTKDILDILRDLVSDPLNKVVISSGRDLHTLESWLGSLPVDMSAEHGAFYKEDGMWCKKISPYSWDNDLIDLLQNFIDKTPRSTLEVKETALVWHYRKVDKWLASLREQQLVNALIAPCTRLNLQITRGSKIVEIKSPEFSKGAEARRLLLKDKYDFIMALGDDTTDEDTFSALPPSAYTIKIGSISKVARYFLLSQIETIPFLQYVKKIKA